MCMYPSVANTHVELLENPCTTTIPLLWTVNFSGFQYFETSLFWKKAYDTYSLTSLCCCWYAHIHSHRYVAASVLIFTHIVMLPPVSSYSLTSLCCRQCAHIHSHLYVVASVLSGLVWKHLPNGRGKTSYMLIKNVLIPLFGGVCLYRSVCCIVCVSRQFFYISLLPCVCMWFKAMYHANTPTSHSYVCSCNGW